MFLQRSMKSRFNMLPQIQIQHFFLSGAIWISTISFSEFIAEYDSCILSPPQFPSIPSVSQQNAPLIWQGPGIEFLYDTCMGTTQ